jgi:hypothetical protein
MKKIRLFANIPNPLDGTSFYRAGGIMPHLMSIMPGLEITPNPTTIDWFMFGFCDVFFMQRPYSDQHVQMAEMARSNCIPVWVDFDDDLFSVPKSNPAASQYGQPNIQRNVAKLIAMADALSVSTEQLKRKFTKLNPNIHVIPNAFNDYMINARPEIGPKKMVINWRGSPTHQKDIGIYADSIVQLARKYPEWKWNFIGHSFWGLIEAMPKESLVECPPVDPVMYWHLIGQLQPGFQIVPLEDNIFNRSKSNIAWQEAAYSGCGSLVPDWEEWNTNPGCLIYRNQKEFREKLEEVCSLRVNLKQLGEDAWRGVTENFLLSKVNQKRAELLSSLVSQRKRFEHSPLVECSPRQRPPSAENSKSSASSPEAPSEYSQSMGCHPQSTTSTPTPDLIPDSLQKPLPIDLLPSYN